MKRDLGDFAGPEGAEAKVTSWWQAEANAAHWMKQWGYADSAVTGGGADQGVDVRSAAALAQVKHQVEAVECSDLQRIFAARSQGGQQLMIFTDASYVRSAVEYADMAAMLLFRYDLDGDLFPENPAAARFLAKMK